MSKSPSGPNRGALLVIDPEPIRRHARDEIASQYAKMMKMRTQIDTFENQDRPAFTRWLHVEFHEQLVDIARLQEKLSAAQELIAEVQMIRFASGCTYHQAYIRAVERRRMGESHAEAFADQDPFSDLFDEEGDSGFDCWEAGGEEEKDSHRYRERNRSGKAGRHGARENASEDESFGFNASKKERSGFGGSFFSGAKRTAKVTADLIKQRYRELARILHPDLRSGGDSWTNELWIRTQNAYTSGNLEELDNLAVLCRVSFGERQQGSPVADLLSALGFLKRSCTSLRRQLNQFRQDLAWGFSSLKDRSKIRRRIGFDLEYEHEGLSVRLDDLERQLARWSVPPEPRRSHSEWSSRSRFRRSGWDFDFDPDLDF